MAHVAFSNALVNTHGLTHTHTSSCCLPSQDQLGKLAGTVSAAQMAQTIKAQNSAALSSAVVLQSIAPTLTVSETSSIISSWHSVLIKEVSNSFKARGITVRLVLTGLL